MKDTSPHHHLKSHEADFSPCPVADAFKEADEQYASLVQRLRSQESQELEHGEVEQMIWHSGHRIVAALIPKSSRRAIPK